MQQVKPRAYEAGLPGMRISEFVVAAWAQNAKAYWSWWGPLGKPMINSIEAWEDMQRGYLQSLSGAPRVVKSTEEAERSVTKVEAAVEAAAAWDESEHPRNAEGQFAEAKQASAFDESEHPRDAKGHFAKVEAASAWDESEHPRDAEGRFEQEDVWDESEHPRGAGGQFAEAKAPVAFDESEHPRDAKGHFAEVPPTEDYDSLNVHEVGDQLGEMNVEEIKDLRAYEAEHKNRQSLLDRVEAKIDAASN